MGDLTVTGVNIASLPFRKPSPTSARAVNRDASLTVRKKHSDPRPLLPQLTQKLKALIRSGSWEGLSAGVVRKVLADASKGDDSLSEAELKTILNSLKLPVPSADITKALGAKPRTVIADRLTAVKSVRQFLHELCVEEVDSVRDISTRLSDLCDAGTWTGLDVSKLKASLVSADRTHTGSVTADDMRRILKVFKVPFADGEMAAVLEHCSSGQAGDRKSVKKLVTLAQQWGARPVSEISAARPAWPASAEPDRSASRLDGTSKSVKAARLDADLILSRLARQAEDTPGQAYDDCVSLFNRTLVRLDSDPGSHEVSRSQFMRVVQDSLEWQLDDEEYETLRERFQARADHKRFDYLAFLRSVFQVKGSKAPVTASHRSKEVSGQSRRSRSRSPFGSPVRSLPTRSLSPSHRDWASRGVSKLARPPVDSSPLHSSSRTASPITRESPRHSARSERSPRPLAKSNSPRPSPRPERLHHPNRSGPDDWSDSSSLTSEGPRGLTRAAVRRKLVNLVRGGRWPGLRIEDLRKDLAMAEVHGRAGSGAVSEMEFVDAIRMAMPVLSARETGFLAQDFMQPGGEHVDYKQFLAWLASCPSIALKEAETFDSVTQSLAEQLDKGAWTGLDHNFVCRVIYAADREKLGWLGKADFLHCLEQLQLPLRPSQLRVLVTHFSETAQHRVPYKSFIELASRWSGRAGGETHTASQAALRSELDAQRAVNAKLRRELASLDLPFFDEVDRMQLRFASLSQRNKALQLHILELSELLGVAATEAGAEAEGYMTWMPAPALQSGLLIMARRWEAARQSAEALVSKLNETVTASRGQAEALVRRVGKELELLDVDGSGAIERDVFLAALRHSHCPGIDSSQLELVAGLAASSGSGQLLLHSEKENTPGLAGLEPQSGLVFFREFLLALGSCLGIPVHAAVEEAIPAKSGHADHAGDDIAVLRRRLIELYDSGRWDGVSREQLFVAFRDVDVSDAGVVPLEVAITVLQSLDVPLGRDELKQLCQLHSSEGGSVEYPRLRWLVQVSGQAAPSPLTSSLPPAIVDGDERDSRSVRVLLDDLFRRGEWAGVDMARVKRLGHDMLARPEDELMLSDLVDLLKQLKLPLSVGDLRLLSHHKSLRDPSQVQRFFAKWQSGRGLEKPRGELSSLFEKLDAVLGKPKGGKASHASSVGSLPEMLRGGKGSKRSRVTRALLNNSLESSGAERSGLVTAVEFSAAARLCGGGGDIAIDAILRHYVLHHRLAVHWEKVPARRRSVEHVEEELSRAGQPGHARTITRGKLALVLSEVGLELQGWELDVIVAESLASLGDEDTGPDIDRGAFCSTLSKFLATGHADE